MRLPYERFSVRRMMLGVAAVLLGVGCSVIFFSRPIAARLSSPMRYPDIRFDLPAGPQVTTLPPMEAGEWWIWVEFPGPDARMSAPWKAVLIDLDSQEVTNVTDAVGERATSSSSDGTVGVRVGVVRAAAGRRYGLRVSCESGRGRFLPGHRPTVLIMAPPGPRKNDMMGFLVRQLWVASTGVLLAVLGGGFGLATIRARSVPAPGASPRL